VPARPANSEPGRHLYFKTSDDFRNTAGALGKGIDTRGVGGFVVAPPPFDRYTKTTYGWADKNAELAALPDQWGLDLESVASQTGDQQ
jgi:hypothetical protein